MSKPRPTTYRSETLHWHYLWQEQNLYKVHNENKPTLIIKYIAQTLSMARIEFLKAIDERTLTPVRYIAQCLWQEKNLDVKSTHLSNTLYRHCL